MKFSYILVLFCLVLLTAMTGCKKLIGTGTPQNQLTTDKVFADSASTEAALVSIYAYLNVNVDPTTNRLLSLYTDEMNFSLSDQATLEFTQSRITTANVSALTAWRNYYQVIYRANDLIAQLNSSELPLRTKALFTSEAKFLRAYAYFYLVNIYGNIPLVLNTDVNANRGATQVGPDMVYGQILTDLQDARDGLPVSYRGNGKVRANKMAAAAVLAKVYLFKGQWANAEKEASAVLNSGIYTPLQSVANSFTANGPETILSIYTVNGFINDATTLVPSTTTGILTYPLSNDLLNSFEANDNRKTNWTKSYTAAGVTYTYPYKYRNRAANTAAPEYLMIMRAAEVYLIRAEAKARQNNVADAITDLNLVRQRAGIISLATTISQSACLDAIDRERRVELFLENGNRFLYLKASGKMNTVLSAYKNTWTTNAQLWPIPQNELTYNVYLQQNPGY